QCFRRMNEIEPGPCCLRMRSTRDFRSSVDRSRVLCVGYVDMRYRVANLLLEDRFRLPGHAGVDLVLHEKQRCLPVVNTRQHGAALGDFGLVDRLGQRLATSLAEGRLDLLSDTLERGIG